ncbi:Laminin subunit gamma-1 [Strongyloides ratti]|uniref:Laminin subunit gamma-1 n=1 Tax=Strongyloides ratti TaxID=34506 RepID=A0A090MTX7_STRRB|nr:Laminin subunit gamma-1 [Strongyloides ratti]CEF61838.1 Laminin subunit gamma-1 [Strongyloides ratti]
MVSFQNLFSKVKEKQLLIKSSFILLTLIILLNDKILILSQPAELTPSIDLEHFERSGDLCYDKTNGNQPQRCVPDFINAAFNKYVDVTNTCGEKRPIKYCVQSKVIGSMRQTCEDCDARVPYLSHPASFLTDFNSPDNETWWQSDTMNEGMQYPNSINLTLKLGKTFDVTYVRLKFVSPRPESFAIYKKNHPDDDWIPWQYYSASCRSTYKLPEKAPILPGHENVAQCTKEYSDISPLTGGNIAFSTLEGRPSSHNFEENEQLQEWVTASEIMISLNRMNTFGDEVFHDTRVLQSYYYAISDFAIGGRCKCNGHASECVRSTGGGYNSLVCRCEHNTMGPDCNECAPFYNDRKWRPATSTDANECVRCECNNLSNRCYYDEELFEKTGRGGHCIDCAGNTRGPHCEECIQDHWRRPNEHFCVPCNCNDIGSVSTQCNSEGKCECKPGVGGDHCDVCLPGFYDFGIHGCKDCGCDISGTIGNTPLCQTTTGECLCKMNVEGRQCDKCKPGYFDLSIHNEFGCTPCFCYGHSSVCHTAEGFFAHNVTSNFELDKESWSGISIRGPATATWAEVDKAIAISNDPQGTSLYFLAPEEFLGDQRASYNQYLTFTLRTQQNYAHVGVNDIIIVGNDGKEVYLPITAQKNPIPTNVDQEYIFKIHASPEYQWSPRMNDLDFIGLLNNITAIKIRGTYTPNDVGFLSKFSLGSVTMTPSDVDSTPAGWVETCECPKEYVGQFCESCAEGYKREIKFGESFTRCVKCDCNGHSDSCDAESGECICEHNTDGATCERCARGWYGNALQGTANDCQKCDCPDNGPCILHTDEEIICTECPVGYSGRKCDFCGDGYYGNPADGIECKECNCNGNIDANSIGNCDTTTGECKKCIYNTRGFNCEECESGFWGNPLSDIKGDCKACNCFAQGTIRPSVDYDVLECNQDNGQCSCQPHVEGPQCDKCEEGYFNITSGIGCESCDCDLTGSLGIGCDIGTGQCKCKPGVTGRRCDQCDIYYYGFSEDGCKLCECNPVGSENMQCDKETGQCQCKDNVEGRQCNVCIENRYNLQGGCPQCDECYTLIQRRVDDYRGKFAKLNETLNEIIDNPIEINDEEFDKKVKEILKAVKITHDDVIKNLGDDSIIIQQISTLRNNLNSAEDMLKEVGNIVNKIRETNYIGEEYLTKWKRIKDEAEAELDAARKYLETEGATQWELAEEAAKKYGDQSQVLSNIAQEARTLANKQESISDDIKRLAEQAKNISETALMESKDAIFGSSETSKQIAKLQEKLEKAKNLLNQTNIIAGEQQKEASKANRQAAEILNSVLEIKPPNINSDIYKEEAKRIAEAAKTTIDNVKNEIKNNKGILEEIRNLEIEAQRELDRAYRQQKQNDDLFNDINAAKERALKAVQVADNTLSEAQQTLKLLQDFQATVDGHKDEAMEELKKIKDIEEKVSEVQEKASIITVAIGDALYDAEEAQKQAATAENEAKEIAEKAEHIKESTSETKKKAAIILEEVNTLREAIAASEVTLNNFKDGAESDSDKADKAVTMAALASNEAETANRTLSKATEKVKMILEQLNSLDNVDNDELNELEKKLDDAESVFNASQLDTKLQSLKDRKKEQDRILISLKSELENLRSERENLDEIQKSLPKKCFNIVSLEQEGQK